MTVAKMQNMGGDANQQRAFVATRGMIFQKAASCFQPPPRTRRGLESQTGAGDSPPRYCFMRLLALTQSTSCTCCIFFSDPEGGRRLITTGGTLKLNLCLRGKPRCHGKNRASVKMCGIAARLRADWILEEPILGKVRGGRDTHTARAVSCSDRKSVVQ